MLQGMQNTRVGLPSVAVAALDTVIYRQHVLDQEATRKREAERAAEADRERELRLAQAREDTKQPDKSTNVESDGEQHAETYASNGGSNAAQQVVGSQLNIQV